LDIYKITEILAYLIIYSFLGWIIESVYKTIYQKKFVNSGLIYGPFCLIYGIGALIMYLLLDDFKNNVIILFLVATAVMSAWEYLAGIILERMFSVRYWDYSVRKFNFQGRICLENAVFWGILGTLFTMVIHPFVTEVVGKVPTVMLRYAVLLLAVYIIADVVVSSIKVINMEIGIAKLKELEEAVRLRLEELKTVRANGKTRVNGIIEEIKNRQEGIKKQVLKQTTRLKNAFPSMKSEKFSEFLNQKMEVFKNSKKE